MDYKAIYDYWLNDPYFDAATRDELRSIGGDENEIRERFYKNLEFGTGGLRGVIGAGVNRMNIYTVSRATQGLCNYILKQKNANDTQPSSIAVAYDSRRFSKEFAVQTALVAAGNGIKAYIFPELAPTPMLSYAVRKLNCASGVVITASHNPPEYNGYKAYWSDGCQIPYPRDEEIIGEVNALTSYADIKTTDRDEAERRGLFQVMPGYVADDYIDTIKKLCININDIKQAAAELQIVYTPLNGTGAAPVKRVLGELGFVNVKIVPEQANPDPDFTTAKSPNPEDPRAFVLAKRLAVETGADIIVATDPDADRVGVVARNAAGDYEHLNGNMTGIILTEYLLSQMKRAGALPVNPAIVSTIVSTKLTARIANAYGAAYFDVLTGFKYIGGKIRDFEEQGGYNYVFGFEESFGYLPGMHARDKDGVASAMLVCETAAYYKQKGMTLFDALNEIYVKYGFYKEGIHTIFHEGIEGAKRIKSIMADLRGRDAARINGRKVLEIDDYQTGYGKNTVTGSTVKLTLPVSDVMYYGLENDYWFCARPSGTEPKIKIYFGVKTDSMERADSELTQFMDDCLKFIGE